MSVLCPFVVAEITRLRAESDDQIVIIQHMLLQVHLPRRQIDLGHLIHQGGDVFARGQNTAQRLGHFGHGQTRGGHLIEQRLKEVVIPAVDQGDPEPLVSQLLGTGQPGESAA